MRARTHASEHQLANAPRRRTCVARTLSVLRFLECRAESSEQSKLLQRTTSRTTTFLNRLANELNELKAGFPTGGVDAGHERGRNETKLVEAAFAEWLATFAREPLHPGVP